MIETISPDKFMAIASDMKKREYLTKKALECAQYAEEINDPSGAGNIYALLAIAITVRQNQ